MDTSYCVIALFLEQICILTLIATCLLILDLSILTPEEIEDAVTVLLHEIDGVSGTQGQQSASRILSFAYQVFHTCVFKYLSGFMASTVVFDAHMLAA